MEQHITTCRAKPSSVAAKTYHSTNQEESLRQGRKYTHFILLPFIIPLLMVVNPTHHPAKCI